jgi:hypothetical protein
MSSNPPTRSRCLLILPRNFYSFASVLTSGLARLGFEASVANDEYPENLFGKIISKLGMPLSHALTRRVLIHQVLAGQHYDLVLVIKGRGLDAATAALLLQHGRHVVGYHFDSFRYDPGPRRWLASLPRVCTFDYHDAREHGLAVVELFTSMPPAPADALTAPRRYKVSAVLRNHSQRLAYLDQVLSALGPLPAGQTFLYIFEANALSFLANFLRNPRLYLKYRNAISRSPLPYDQYVAAIAGSELTIDYAHPRQTGITIRCFEALSAGTRLITNNAWVLRSIHFSKDNAVVFGADGSAADLREQLQALPSRQPQARRRSVDDFLRELIGPNALVALDIAPQADPATTLTTP